MVDHKSQAIKREAEEGSQHARSSALVVTSRRLTADKVLDERRDLVLLERLDRWAYRLAGEERIRGKAFPVATTIDRAAHRTNDDGKRDLSAEAGVFGTDGGRAFVENVAVPGCGGSDFGGELGRVPRIDT